MLLSSLPGAAVTWVKIDGVQHEFSTIPHVKEDTLDFLLNIKELRLRNLAQHPGKLVLEVGGEREVRAADINPSADFEIVNPDLHLATLDSIDARLYAELNVDLGKGYVPASSNSGLPIGAIPIDSIFTPIRRVNFSIEPSSIMSEINQEKLVLEIKTDGALSPMEALSQGAALLTDLFSSFKELAKSMIEEGTELAWQRLIPAGQYNIPLGQLNLSTHTYNSLRRGNIAILGELLEKAESLSSLTGFGAKSRTEVAEVLKNLDLPFVPDMNPTKKGQQKSQASADSEAENET